MSDDHIDWDRVRAAFDPAVKRAGFEAWKAERASRPQLTGDMTGPTTEPGSLGHYIETIEALCRRMIAPETETERFDDEEDLEDDWDRCVECREPEELGDGLCWACAARERNRTRV